jgi:integrase
VGISGPLVGCEVPPALSIPDVGVLAAISRAINLQQAICVTYSSFSSGRQTREIVSHALADNGLRWHVRAFDRKGQRFVDFVLTRIHSFEPLPDSTITSLEKAQNDLDWTRVLELASVPHPKEEHKEIIAMDYAMAQGVMSGLRLTLNGYAPEFGLREARAEVTANQDLLKQGIDPRTVRVRKHKRGSPPAPLVAATALLVSTSSGPADIGKAPGVGSLLTIVPSTWPRDSHSLRLFAALTPLPADQRHSVEFLIYEFVLLFVARARKDTATIARVLRVEALAHWRGRDARTITPREVIERLDAIVQRESFVMANRVAAILRQLFLHGVHRATIPSSPVQLLLPPGGKESARTRALSDEEIGRFLVHRFELCSTERLARVLTILLLTSVRRSELCRARWDHIDFENRTWRIPAEHTKSQRALLVPLSDRLLEEFRALRRLAGPSAYVIPAKRLDSPIDPPSITQSTARCMWRFKLVGIEPFTPHDLRRSCRTGLSRIGVRRFIARRVLNHKQEGVDGLRRPPTHRLTRQELHRMVWSEPRRLLCKKFDISDVWLAKICRRHHIPIPCRGHWAMRQAGHLTELVPLPAPTAEISEWIEIRGKDILRYAKPQLTQSRRPQTDPSTEYPVSGERGLAAAT